MPTTLPGIPYPLGASKIDKTVNFAIYAPDAEKLNLSIFHSNTKEPNQVIQLDPKQNKTGKIWHVALEGLPNSFWYGYTIPDKTDILLDPYAQGVSSGNTWMGQTEPYRPLGLFQTPKPFDWEGVKNPRIPAQDLIIYEMHVRGFTEHPSSGVSKVGTFQGLKERIPYLVDLGVNAVELMPIFEFNEAELTTLHPVTHKKLCNYWGYSTMSFFSLMNRYASSNDPGAALEEFKSLVKEFHKNGIEVILDVVYNHTGEGNNQGPVLSFKGFGNSTYYMLNDKGEYLNFSGCGNTFNCNHPVVRRLIIDSLRYWVLETHVDGFRFDLASILNRDRNGNPLEPSPLVEEITEDPVLADTKLIAEAWDAGGLYQVGNFYPGNPRWNEWNGKYRDCIRKVLKGAPWLNGEFATRLSGSNDIYWNRGGPNATINFVTCHDGFTLRDLVSYNHKHNLINGEQNRDGENNNESWNCGAEGETKDKKIHALRERQMKNFQLALMVSQGIPMIFMGDEYGHTKKGNNNSWCQDDLNWFLWNELPKNEHRRQFLKKLIQFRKEHALLRRDKFLEEKDIIWHGSQPMTPKWNDGNPFLAFTLVDSEKGEDIYVAFNGSHQEVKVQIPPPGENKKWHWVINTAEDNTQDAVMDKEELTMIPHSSLLLIKH